MDDKTQLEILLRVNGFRIARRRKHEIWRRDDGKIWVVPRTPSDRHAYKNALGHFRAFLAGRRFGAIHQPVPRIAAKPKDSSPHAPSAQYPRRLRVKPPTEQKAIQSPEQQLTTLEISGEHVYRFGSVLRRSLQEQFVRPRMDALVENWFQSAHGLLSCGQIENSSEVRWIRDRETKLAAFTVALFQRALRELAANGKISRSALQEKLNARYKKLFPNEGREMRPVRRWLIRFGFVGLDQFLCYCATDAGIPVLVPRGGDFVVLLVEERKAK